MTMTGPKPMTHAYVHIFSFIICTAVPPAHAQLSSPLPPPPPDNFPTQYSTSSFTLAMTLTLVFVILVFVITSLIAICINRFATDHNTGQQAVERPREMIGAGLDPSLVEMFPVLDYAGVKGMKIGNGPLECAVCLSEFVDNDKIRLLLPGCCHAFHPDCIDGWLKNHVTCPVCRSELTHNGEQNLAVAAVDRFTLRLPEHVQRDIEASRSGEQRMDARIAGHRYEVFPASNSGKTWSFLRVFSSRRQPDIEIGEGSVRSVGSIRRDGSVRSVRLGSLRLSSSKEEANANAGSGSCSTNTGTVLSTAAAASETQTIRSSSVKSIPELTAASRNSAPLSPSERRSTELATLN